MSSLRRASMQDYTIPFSRSLHLFWHEQELLLTVSSRKYSRIDLVLFSGKCQMNITPLTFSNTFRQLFRKVSRISNKLSDFFFLYVSSLLFRRRWFWQGHERNSFEGYKIWKADLNFIWLVPGNLPQNFGTKRWIFQGQTRDAAGIKRWGKIDLALRLFIFIFQMDAKLIIFLNEIWLDDLWAENWFYLGFK